MVSVIIPARNEEHNIAECLRSILGNIYSRFEVIVVDDQSTDRTGEIAREISGHDPRVRVVLNTALPDGWLGKPWACATGAEHASGDILCFTDADTLHRPDALVRSINAMSRREADLFSIYSGQRFETRWERIIQPHVFALIALRFGGTETVTRSPRVLDKITNGQCLFATRPAYDQMGGHHAVRGYFNEDVMIAQHFFANGKRVVLTSGVNQTSTRMYTSLSEMVHGWGRTLYSGARLSTPSFGSVSWIVHPVLSVLPLMMELAPVIVLIRAAFTGISSPVLIWAVLSTLGMLWWWHYVYAGTRHRILYALIYPFGATVVFYIYLRAIFRGSRVTWKGRAYVSE